MLNAFCKAHSIWDCQRCKTPEDPQVALLKHELEASRRHAKQLQDQRDGYKKALEKLQDEQKKQKICLCEDLLKRVAALEAMHGQLECECGNPRSVTGTLCWYCGRPPRNQWPTAPSVAAYSGPLPDDDDEKEPT